MFVRIDQFWVNTDKVVAVGPDFNNFSATNIFMEGSDTALHVNMPIEEVIDRIGETCTSTDHLEQINDAINEILNDIHDYCEWRKK